MEKRYTQWITGDFDLSTAADRSSYRSVHGRIEAMQDGFKIGLAHPIFGVGPGGSRYARKQLRGHAVVDTHNAYAQIAADLGLVGLAIFLVVFITPFFSLWLIDRRWARGQGSPMNIVSLTARCLRDIFFISICYGMFAHNAYTFRWLFPLAWYGAFVAIISRYSAVESLQPESPSAPAKTPIAA